MTLAPNTLYWSDPGFTSLFRFLDDFNNYKREGTGATHFHPKFDIIEHDKEYELHGEVPGLDKKDLHIEFTHPQTLLMRGRVERSYSAGTPPEASQQEVVKEGKTDNAAAGRPKYWASERSIGEFSRTFSFSHDVDPEKVTAQLQDGVVTVHVPKCDKPKGRLIEVK